MFNVLGVLVQYIQLYCTEYNFYKNWDCRMQYNISKFYKIAVKCNIYIISLYNASTLDSRACTIKYNIISVCKFNYNQKLTYNHKLILVDFPPKS